ncbi:phage major capsid protein [Holzapfeliella sp. JNUCC 80]
MPSPIILNQRLNLKTKALEEKRSALKELAKSEKEIETRAAAVTTDEELDAISKESDELETVKTSLRSEVTELESAVANLEEEVRKASGSTTKERKEEDNMPTTENFKEVRSGNEKEKQLRGLMKFIQSRGEDKSGITTDSENFGALIPKDIQYSLNPAVETTYDLSQYVNVENVPMSGGQYFVQKNATDRLYEKEELDTHPELDTQAYKTIKWNVTTRSGSIMYSFEAMQDVYQLENFLQKHVSQRVVNTKNAMIGQAIKKSEIKEVEDLDAIKDVIDDLDPAYQEVKIYLTKSAFNFLNKLKDKNGNYLLEKDPQAPSGKAVDGVPIVKISDNLLGKGAGFVGSLRSYTTLFDRAEVSLGWDTPQRFAKNIGVATRSDIKVTDEDAGKMIQIKSIPNTGYTADYTVVDSKKDQDSTTKK